MSWLIAASSGSLMAVGVLSGAPWWVVATATAVSGGVYICRLAVAWDLSRRALKRMDKNASASVTPTAAGVALEIREQASGEDQLSAKSGRELDKKSK